MKTLCSSPYWRFKVILFLLIVASGASCLPAQADDDTLRNNNNYDLLFNDGSNTSGDPGSSGGGKTSGNSGAPGGSNTGSGGNPPQGKEPNPCQKQQVGGLLGVFWFLDQIFDPCVK